MENSAKKIDQKFAVICYAVSVCISTILSALVQATIKKDTNLYIYLCYLLPQTGYITVFWVMWIKNGNKPKDLLKKENVRGLEYLYGTIIAVGLLFFALLPNNYINKLFEIIGLRASVTVPTMEHWYDFVLCGLTICVLPAIGEELIFRKAFCDGMSDVDEYKVILLCGLAFSLSHLNPAQTVHQFIFGCILALVYVKTKNITVTMLMHLINNMLALYLERITGAELWNNITVMAISCASGAIIISLGLFLLLRGKKGNNTKNGKIETITVILLVVLGIAWAITLGFCFVD